MNETTLARLGELTEEEGRILAGAVFDTAAYFSESDSTVNAEGGVRPE